MEQRYEIKCLTPQGKSTVHLSARGKGDARRIIARRNPLYVVETITPRDTVGEAPEVACWLPKAGMNRRRWA